MKDEIKKILEKITGKNNFLVEAPKEKTHGDYATNVALVLSKKAGKNPLEVANEIVKKLSSGVLKKIGIEKVEVASPGFINFYLKDEFFVENLKEILKEKENYGKNQNLKGKKIIIEHTQPNPFKAFHIGHLMNNTIGQSVARIIKANGTTVKTATYHGDVGSHVAKAVWALQKGIPMKDAYAYGHKGYEENESSKQEILDINKKIYNKSDKQINAIFKKGRKESLVNFEKIYKKLDSKFDFHFYESQTGDIGKKLVLKNIGKIFEKGEGGAIIFKGENFEPKTHTRVFLNSEGLPTYEGKEVGLAKIKKSKFNYNISITVTANEQDAFFNVVEVSIGEVFNELKGKLKHLSHGLLKLPSGKMSSRTGNIISAESMIDRVKEKVLEKIKDRDFSELEKKEITEKVAIGAIKYSILKQSIGSDIVYDLEKSVSFEGDSGPYLQYSYARAMSVLRKAKDEKIKPSLKKVPTEISQLEKMMSHFGEAVEKAGKEYEPHFVALYLTELAREFNNYYDNNKIVDKNDEFSDYRVALTEAFSIIMKNGLWLLGIETPEKM